MSGRFLAMDEQHKKNCLRRHYFNMTMGRVLLLKSQLTKKKYLILVKRVNYAKGYEFIVWTYNPNQPILIIYTYRITLSYNVSWYILFTSTQTREKKMYLDHSERLTQVRNCRAIARTNNLTVSVGPQTVTFLGTADYQSIHSDKFMSISDFIKKYAA